MHDEKLTSPTDEEEIPLSMDDLRQQIRDLRTLSTHPGWLYVEKHLKDQVARRVDEIVLLPIEDINKSIKVEYVKGECGGIRLTLLSPSMHVEILEAELLQLEEAIKQQEASTKTSENIDEEDPNNAW